MDNLLDKLEEYAERNGHPDIDWNADEIVLINHSDGAGDHILVWNASWPQPSEAEIAAMDAPAQVRREKKNNFALTWLIVRERIADELSIPLAEVSREMISEASERWAADAEDMDLPPQSRNAARQLTQWLELQYRKRRNVNKKIDNGMYTTEDDVRNASEW